MSESAAGFLRAVSQTRAARRLDISAFVERESPALLGYFARRVTQVEDSADLLGDTLLIVWRREQSIPKDSVSARMWLYGVARNVLSTYRRSGARRTALGDKLRMELAAAPRNDRDELGDHVRALVSDLDEIDRDIIDLVYWQGFSLAEAAKILGKRPNTIRSRHARAREELRQALAASGDIADN